MAFIERNALVPSVMKLNGMHSIHNRMRKVWPRETIDGIEVYSDKLYFYRNKRWIRTKALERFLKSLGIDLEEFYTQTLDNEIEDVWFNMQGGEFDWDGSYAGDQNIPHTTTKHVTTANDIVNTFNEAFEVGKEYKVTVQYGGPSKRYLSSHKLNFNINTTLGLVESENLDTVAIRNQINSDPWLYLANAQNISSGNTNPFQLYDGGNIGLPNMAKSPSHMLTGACMVSTTFEGREKPIKSVNEPMYELACFAPMDNSVFERIDGSLEETLGAETSTRNDGEVITYTYTYTYVYKGITEGSPLVMDMLKYYDTEEPFKLKRKLRLGTNLERYNFLTSITKDNIYKKSLDTMKVYTDPNTQGKVRGYTNNLWYAGKLRYEEARKMRRRDFVTMLATVLDTDYEVEEASWWEKVLAVVIVILAVVAFIWTLGSSSVVTAAIIVQAASATSMVLAIGGFILAQLGGLSAMGLVEFIGSFAQIVGYMAMAAGFYTLIQNAGKVLAEQTLRAAGKEVTVEAVKQEMINQTFTDQLGALLKQSLDKALGSVTKFMNMGFDDLVSTVLDNLDFINKGMSMYADKENEELRADTEAYEEEQRAYEQEILNNQLKSPAEVWVLMEDKITSPDMLTTLNQYIQSSVGQDKSFAIWYSNVNSK